MGNQMKRLAFANTLSEQRPTKPCRSPAHHRSPAEHLITSGLSVITAEDVPLLLNCRLATEAELFL